MQTYIHERFLGETSDTLWQSSNARRACCRRTSHHASLSRVEIGVRSESTLWPTGLHICGWAGQVVDRVRPRRIPLKAWVDLPVTLGLVRSRTVRPVLIGINQPGNRVDRLVTTCARPSTFWKAQPVVVLFSRHRLLFVASCGVPIRTPFPPPWGHGRRLIPLHAVLHGLQIGFPFKRVGVARVSVARRVFNRVHCLHSLFLPLWVDYSHVVVSGVGGQKQPHAGYNNLDRSMSNLNVLESHLATNHETWLQRMICIFWNLSCVVMRLAAWAVHQPPAEAPGAEAEDVIVAVKVANVKVVADDECVEAQPEYGPKGVSQDII